MTGHGGKRPGAGRPRSERGEGSPQTVIRWSPEEYALVSAKAGGPRLVAAWLRTWALKQARRK